MLDSESWPKEGTISLMTDVIGLRVVRLVVRSGPPGRALKDHDWLREWLRGPGGKGLGLIPSGTVPTSEGSSSMPISWAPPFMTLNRLDFIAVLGEGINICVTSPSHHLPLF